MRSITKTKISDQQIESLAKKAFGENVTVKEIIELKEGFFNTAYQLLVNSQKVVLKVSPPKDVTVMRYEKNLMRNEVSVLRAMGASGTIPVPKVLFYDTERDLIENEYFFMDFVQGISLNSIHENLSQQHKRDISNQLGTISRDIVSIYSDCFGDISNPEKQFSNWKEAFLFMINELMSDAADKNVILPMTNEEIIRLMYKNSNCLESVKKASTIHKDMWMGNIFVDTETIQITGIVDCERAVFGDPLLEPVCAFLLEDKVFMENFYGKTQLSDEEKLRTILYRIYLFLIIIIECSYRLYEDDGLEKWAREQLDTALKDLSAFNVC